MTACMIVCRTLTFLSDQPSSQASLKNLSKALLNTVGIPVVSPRSRFTDDQFANGLGGFANVSVQLADVS